MPRGLSYVCISLAGAIERRTRMLEQFSSAGIKPRFFGGIEPYGKLDEIPGNDVSARIRRYGRPLSNGEIGCYLSHREVWKQLVNSSDSAWCVMEDDIGLRGGFRAAVEELFVHREHWDMVRLMGLVKREQLPYADLPSGTRIMWLDRQPVGTQCYIITRTAAARMLKHTERIVHAIDTTIDRHWEHRLRLLITSPEYVEAFESESMVGFRPGITTLAMRLREKIYRRVDKTAAAIYNARHRPRRVMRLNEAGRLDQGSA
jgi:glycosyl transferase family 25